MTEELEDEVFYEPECSEHPDVIEEMGIECEFERRDGYWWCMTHNCSA